MEHAGRPVNMFRRFATSSRAVLTIGSMRKREPRLLHRVVKAARRTLRDMEGRDVPRTLHRVRQRTGRTLPAPLEEHLLRELDENDWFREQVAGSVGGAEESDDPYERAAELFLLRHEGWEDRLEGIRRDLSEARKSDRLRRSKQRISELESDLKRWKADARRARKDAEKAERRADRRVEEAWAEARSTVESGLIETCEQQRREIRRLTGELEETGAELVDARGRLAAAREDLERERRVDHAPPARPGKLNVWADMGAVEAARQLDEVVNAFFPGPAPIEVRPVSAGREPLVLPAGTPPDSRDAVRWLLELDRPFALLVDGYNVTGKMYPADRYPPDRFSLPETRDRLQNDLAELMLRAKGSPRITVVWDSGEAAEMNATVLRSGIEVRYTSEGRKADDELIDLARDLGASAAVVSSDREVREGAQRAGSLGLWSEALAAWALDG